MHAKLPLQVCFSSPNIVFAIVTPQWISISIAALQETCVKSNEQRTLNSFQYYIFSQMCTYVCMYVCIHVYVQKVLGPAKCTIIYQCVYSYHSTCIVLLSYHLIFLVPNIPTTLSWVSGLNWLQCLLLCLCNVVGKCKQWPCAVVMGQILEW